MHHSHAETEAMKRLVRELKLGATGRFPEGRLNETDEGEIKIAVGVENGKVVIIFGKPTSWIGFDPKQARQLAESLRQKSHLAEGRT